MPLYHTLSAQPNPRAFAPTFQRASVSPRSRKGEQGLRHITPDVYIGKEFRPRKRFSECQLEFLWGEEIVSLSVVQVEAYPAGIPNAFCACIDHPHPKHPADSPSHWASVLQLLNSPHSRYLTVDNILYLRGTATSLPRRVLLASPTRQQAIQHAHQQCGHRGREPTYFRLKQQYYWPSLYHDVAAFVHSCLGCRSSALSSRPLSNPLIRRVFLVQVRPMVTGTNGNQYLMEAYDPLVDLHVVAGSSVDSPEALAIFLEHQIIRRYGTACALTGHQRGLLSQACSILRDVYRSPVYMDSGPVMQLPHTHVADSLAICARRRPSTWPLFIPAVNFAHSSIASCQSGVQPECQFYGTRPSALFDIDDPCWQIIPWHDSHSNTAALIACRAEQLVRVMSTPQVARMDRYSRDVGERQWLDNVLSQFSDFIPGMWVLHLKEDGEGRRIMTKYTGPYVVREVAPGGEVILSECDGTRLARSVPARSLRLFTSGLGFELFFSPFEGEDVDFPAAQAEFYSRLDELAIQKGISDSSLLAYLTWVSCDRVSPSHAFTQLGAESHQ